MDASSLATRLFNRTKLFISPIEKSSGMYLSVKDLSKLLLLVGKSDKKEKRVVGIEPASLAWKAKGYSRHLLGSTPLLQNRT